LSPRATQLFCALRVGMIFALSGGRAGTLCEALLFGALGKKLLAIRRNLIGSMKVSGETPPLQVRRLRDGAKKQ
jgi:hypothetical protein